MPGGNRNHKKKNNNYYSNNQHHHNLNGGGVRKGQSYHGGNGNNNNRNYGNRKIYLNPSIISSLSDDESISRNSDRQGNYQNGYNNNRGSSEHRKSHRDNRKKFMDNLKDIGVVKEKTKLTIGDDDTEIKKTLLESKQSCQISNLPPGVFDLIVNYVQNYFTCFDSNRNGLLGAYNQNCTFSLTLNMGNTNAYRQYKFDERIVRENRNLKRIVGNEEHHIEKRYKLQHKGCILTLAELCKIPPTEHDPRSFKLDVSYFSPNMIKFSLTGVFKEGKPTDKVRPLRSFHRTFVCIPDTTSQMSIVNEQFIMSHITNEQYKTYFYTPPNSNPEEKAEQTMNQMPNETFGASNPVLPPGLNEQQALMLKEFSAQSRLNHEWSKYCLEHVNWNFDEAAKAFIQFKDSIPQDAYLK